MYNKKRIFTFWEPKGNIHGYLKLCMKTWEKFLPEYEIVILDYSNIKDWLGNNYFDNYLFKNFPLSIQADAIRVALLKKYGGFWFDVDTIITSEKFKELDFDNSDLTNIGKHISILYAKPQSAIINKWDRVIKKKIELRKKSRNIYNYIFHYSYWRKFKDWAYLGNSIFDSINKNKTQKVYHSFNEDKLCVLPEYMENNKYAAGGVFGVLKISLSLLIECPFTRKSLM